MVNLPYHDGLDWNTEGKCVRCGNNTTLNSEGVCAVCAAQEPIQEKPQPISNSTVVSKDKIYQLAIPNLASDTQHLIAKECIHIARVLLEKNRKYGDSALKPIRAFSKSGADEQLRVRLDDKLTRLINRAKDEDEDVELDFIGYLILLRIWRQLQL